MPLSEKARIEVYLPDVPDKAYDDLLETFETEFAYSFGGCTVLLDLRGSYLSADGSIVKDRVNLLYTDTPFDFGNREKELSSYAEALRRIAFDALNEEDILIVVSSVQDGSPRITPAPPPVVSKPRTGRRNSA